jgi:hypothetical protein
MQFPAAGITTWQRFCVLQNRSHVAFVTSYVVFSESKPTPQDLDFCQKYDRFLLASKICHLVRASSSSFRPPQGLICAYLESLRVVEHDEHFKIFFLPLANSLWLK